MDFRTYFDNQTGGNDTEEIEELEEIDKKLIKKMMIIMNKLLKNN